MNIILSFDDGRSDAYKAYEILKQHLLVASFHVTTGFIDGSFKTNQFGIDRDPLTIEQLLEMHNNKMDVSSHSDKHVLDNNDFKESINKLSSWGIKKMKYGFSIPNSSFNDQLLSDFIVNNIESLLYIRCGRDEKCYSFFSKVKYFVYHMTKANCLYFSFNKHNILSKIDKYKLSSLVIKKDVKAKSLIQFINKYKTSHDNTLIIMLHSIVNNPSNKWEWSTSNFINLCEYLENEQKKNTIKVLTLEELIKGL